MMRPVTSQSWGRMTSSLSHADVARLLAEPSANSRVALAGKLGLELDSSKLAAHELELAQDIVRILSKDIEAGVRTALAHSVRDARNLPRDVALRMAEDVESVALPVLSHSLVLTDDDLIAIVQRASEPRQAAIAVRPAVSERVSDALATHGGENAVAALMGNAGAQIAEPALSRAVDRFPASDAVKEAMVRRDTLPAAVAERLVALVSRRLQDHLVRHHNLPPGTAADLVMRGRERAVIRLSAGADDADLQTMVAQMHHTGRLTPSLLIRALCTGDLGFFEAGLAELTGVKVENVQILLHDAGPNGLVSLYRRSGLPPELFNCVRAAVDVVNETGFDGEPRELERYRAHVIARVLTQAEDFDPDDVDYLVDKLGDALNLAA